MKRSKEIIGVPVISISAGIQVGIVKGLVLNPQQKTVEFLLLNEEENSKGMKGIPFRYAEGIGEYAVTVENESVMMEISRIGILQELMEKHINIIGTKVITRKGKYLGDANEYSIDTETGILKEVYYLADNENEYKIPVEKVITLGTEVLVVEDMAAIEAAAPSETDQINFKGGDDRFSGIQGLDQVTTKQPDPPKPATEQPEVVTPSTGTLQEFPTENSADHAVNHPVAEQPDQDTLNLEAGLTEKAMLSSRTPGDLDPADAFIQRQRQFLIGKTLLKDLQSKEGEVIAWENELVTEHLFDKVYKIGAQKIMELAMSVRD